MALIVGWKRPSNDRRVIEELRTITLSKSNLRSSTFLLPPPRTWWGGGWRLILETRQEQLCSTRCNRTAVVVKDHRSCCICISPTAPYQNNSITHSETFCAKIFSLQATVNNQLLVAQWLFYHILLRTERIPPTAGCVRTNPQRFILRRMMQYDTT